MRPEVIQVLETSEIMFQGAIRAFIYILSTPNSAAIALSWKSVVFWSPVPFRMPTGLFTLDI
jgi:hypothetical protein